MNNKNLIIVLAVVLVALLGGGYYFLFANKTTAPTAPTTQEIQVLSLKPEEIGLTMTARDDKRAVKFTISKPDGITALDYELDYNAQGNIPRGVIGSIPITAGMSKIESNNPDTNGYLVLGSSSSGHYKYDTGVTSVNLVLRVTKSDGKTYEVKDSLDLTK